MKAKILLLLSLGHLITDINQGMLPALLPFLKEGFHLSYTQLGFLVLIANISSSTLQPFIGYFSDKIPTRWLLPVGIFLACIGIGLVGISPTYPLLLLAILISGIGIAIYHPESSKTAYFASGAKKGGAMSIFAIGGNMGMALGPPLILLLISLHGLGGTLWMALLGAVAALLFWASLPMIQRECPVSAACSQNGLSGISYSQIVPVAILILVVTFRSWITAAMTVYIPLYFISFLEGDPLFGNVLLTIFLLSGAAGTFFGGFIADKIGPRNALLWAMALMIPLVFLTFNTSGVWLIISVAAAGGVLVSTFAVTIVLAQQLLPNNIGMASGLMTGFGIGMGGIGLIPLGLIADTWGVPLALKVIMILPVIGTIVSLKLPNPSAVPAFSSAGEKA